METNVQLLREYAGPQQQTAWGLFFFATPLTAPVSRTNTTLVRALGCTEVQQLSLKRHVKVYTRHLMHRVLRYRVERFLFDTTYYRTYVYFKNILNLTIYKFSFWRKSEQQFLAAISSKTGKQFLVNESFSFMLVRSMGLVFTVVGGLFFFTRLFSSLMYQFRRHWALIRFVGNLLNMVRLNFWYHSHVQFRMMLFGRFGGIMRASKQILGQGAVKLYIWQGVMDYVQSDFCTKWGTFGFSFWLQFHNVPQLKINRFVQRYRKVLRALALGEVSLLDRVRSIKPSKLVKFRDLSVADVVAGAERRRDFGARLHRSPAETPLRLLSAWRSLSWSRAFGAQLLPLRRAVPVFIKKGTRAFSKALNLFNLRPRRVHRRSVLRRRMDVRVARFGRRRHKGAVRHCRNQWFRKLRTRAWWRRLSRRFRFKSRQFRGKVFRRPRRRRRSAVVVRRHRAKVAKKTSRIRDALKLALAPRSAISILRGRSVTSRVRFGFRNATAPSHIRAAFGFRRAQVCEARRIHKFWDWRKLRSPWAVRRLQRRFRWHAMYPRSRRFFRRWRKFTQSLRKHAAHAASVRKAAVPTQPMRYTS